VFKMQEDVPTKGRKWVCGRLQEVMAKWGGKGGISTLLDYGGLVDIVLAQRWGVPLFIRGHSSRRKAERESLGLTVFLVFAG